MDKKVQSGTCWFVFGKTLSSTNKPALSSTNFVENQQVDNQLSSKEQQDLTSFTHQEVLEMRLDSHFQQGCSLHNQTSPGKPQWLDRSAMSYQPVP